VFVIILFVSPSAEGRDLHGLLMVRPVNVESEGPYAPERLLSEAIKVMREKLVAIRKAAEALLDQDGVGGDVQMADV
jgi:hypothetical protein